MIWECLTSIATVGSLFFVARQTTLLRKSYEYNCDWQEKEKAAALSHMYKNEILPNVAYIGGVLKDTEIMSLLGNIRENNIELFNQAELFRLTQNDIIAEFSKKKNSFDTIGALIKRRIGLGQTHGECLHSINETLIYRWDASQRGAKDKSGNVVTISDQEKTALMVALWFEFEHIVSETLNVLEYFSMNFNYGIADDNVVFQSLHQTYIPLVQMLYFYISAKNIYEKDKFYTNVIELYKRWVDKDRNNEKRADDARCKPAPVRK